MTQPIREVEVLRKGDRQGNQMVIALETASGKRIRAVGIPQTWGGSRVGPTWVYLLEEEGGLVLIDAASHKTYQNLESGLALLGVHPRDLDGIIVTHGHADHDGGVADVVGVGDAQLWAHDIYPHLLTQHRWNLEWAANPLMQPTLLAMAHHPHPPGDLPPHIVERMRQSGTEFRHNIQAEQRPGDDQRFTWGREYQELRRHYRVGRALQDGDRIGDLEVLYTPGHSADEICVKMDGVLFTGDHVLPEITPHPTMKMVYTAEMRAKMPSAYHHEDAHFGLRAYLTSLKRVLRLDSETAVLPAHRLFTKGRWNLLTIARGQEILAHHLVRMDRMLHTMGTQGKSLVHLARSEFTRSQLASGNLPFGVSEIVSHVEFLLDTGDAEMTPDGNVRWLGTEHYRKVVASL